jgi:hypothetical protein
MSAEPPRAPGATPPANLTLCTCQVIAAGYVVRPPDCAIHELPPASASRGETPPRDAPVLDAAQRALAELTTGPKAGRSDYSGMLSLQHATALHDEMSRLRAALSASQRAREESRDEAAPASGNPP